MSGRERSSTKRNLPGAVRVPGLFCAGYESRALFYEDKDVKVLKEDIFSLYEKCNLCPRACQVNRLKGERGACGSSSRLLVARAGLHMWEEPVISGSKGSGTVFFAGCSLHCVFCQNNEISGINPKGKELSVEELSDILLKLEKEGANNINFVTPTHFMPHIYEAVILSKERGLKIPIIYNTSGYEKKENLKILEGLVDVYLPDAKYVNEGISKLYSNASDYGSINIEALKEMVSQTGPVLIDEESGLIKKGVIVRHLVLPGHTRESMEVIKRLYLTFKDDIYISIMRQYTPFEDFLPKGEEFKNLHRRVTKREYDKVVDFSLDLGIKNAFIQEVKTALESFVPSFDCNF